MINPRFNHGTTVVLLPWQISHGSTVMGVLYHGRTAIIQLWDNHASFITVQTCTVRPRFDYHIVVPWYDSHGSTMVQPWFIYHDYGHGKYTKIRLHGLSWFDYHGSTIVQPWFTYNGTIVTVPCGYYRGTLTESNKVAVLVNCSSKLRPNMHSVYCYNADGVNQRRISRHADNELKNIVKVP